MLMEAVERGGEPFSAASCLTTCTYLGDDSRAACNFLTGQVDDTLSL